MAKFCDLTDNFQHEFLILRTQSGLQGHLTCILSFEERDITLLAYSLHMAHLGEKIITGEAMPCRPATSDINEDNNKQDLNKNNN